VGCIRIPRRCCAPRLGRLEREFREVRAAGVLGAAGALGRVEETVGVDLVRARH
jgi:hypothetical protein